MIILYIITTMDYLTTNWSQRIQTNPVANKILNSNPTPSKFLWKIQRINTLPRKGPITWQTFHDSGRLNDYGLITFDEIGINNATYGTQKINFAGPVIRERYDEIQEKKRRRAIRRQARRRRTKKSTRSSRKKWTKRSWNK